MEEKRLSQRLDSCRQVLQAINQMLRRRQRLYNQPVLEQMNQLEQLMTALDTKLMTEFDMQRVEFSTNQLFSNLTNLFEPADMGKLSSREMLH